MESEIQGVCVVFERCYRAYVQACVFGRRYKASASLRADASGIVSVLDEILMQVTIRSLAMLFRGIPDRSALNDDLHVHRPRCKAALTNAE